MIEPMRGVAWMTAKLQASSAFVAACPGGIWRGVAPQNVTTYPLCVIHVQQASDVHGSNQARLWSEGYYAMRIIGPTDDSAGLVTAADAADTALQDQSGTAQGGTIMSCLRDAPIGPTEDVVNGVRYTTVGGLYQLLVRPS